MRKIFVFLLAVFFVASLSAGGQKDSGGEFKYPTKTIELIGTSPGGDSDLFPRITAKYLEKLWGVTITMNVTERTLAQIQRGYMAPPDGYTVLSNQDAMLINMVNGALDFSLDDMTIVAKYAELPGQILYVRADSGWKTLADVVKACAARPDMLTLGAQIASTTGVMAGMLQTAGLKARVVDCGGSERVALMEGGHLDMALSPWNRIESYVKAGKWIPLAILETERVEMCPQIPTAKEQGFDVVYPTRHVIYLPKGVDPRIVEEWNKALLIVSKDPAYQKELYDVGKGYARYTDPIETRKILDRVMVDLKKYIK
jgi:tripartite-type tricarboxylate transporter receptor subunit TctC